METKNNGGCLIVLAGTIVRDSSTGKWRTTSFSERDHAAVLGDQLRVVAAYHIYKRNPDIVIITSGGVHWDNTPAFAEVLKNELVELGVPQENIIEEDRSHGTYGQLKECAYIIERHEFKNIMVLSNRYHLPRIAAMIKMREELKLFSNAELVVAEKILLQENEVEWQDLISKAYNSKEMRERINLEKQGTTQILDGAYKYNL